MSTEESYGIDFGTSNSSVSIFQHNNSATLPINFQGDDKEVFESTIYFSDENIFFGREAITTYLADIDRNRNFHDYKLGRLIRSFKSALGQENLPKTLINGKIYTLEDLVALFLREIKTRADRLTEKKVENVVIGRPVKFVGNTRDNEAHCLERLTNAAHMAGFKSVKFEYEPVGAAYSYQLNKSTGNILVFDFGGGTLDLSVVEINNDKPVILSNHGLTLGGDVLDFGLYNKYFSKYFGKNLKYKNGQLEYPHRAVEKIIDWSEITNLRNENFFNFLNMIKPSANSLETVLFIEDFLKKNLTYSFRKAVSECKANLSFAESVSFTYDETLEQIYELVEKKVFESLLDDYQFEIQNLLAESLLKAKKLTTDINTVVMTGGSSQIPKVQKILKDYFVNSEVVIHQPFTAVSKGLALIH